MSVKLSQNALRTLEDIKQELKKDKDLENIGVKSNLYGHLTEVFSRIIDNHTYDGFDKFEEISVLVKQTNLKIVDPKYDYEINNQGLKSLTKDQAFALIEKAKNLLKEVPDVGITDADKSLLTKDQQFIIPHLQEQAQMLEWAGINFGEDIVFLLQKSIKRLAVLSGATSLRFFGKVFGTQKDYWIVQGQLPDVQFGKIDEYQEKRNTGTNASVFWVADNLLMDWIQLPDVHPNHLMSAHLIKQVFTGNLNQKIDSNPPFPGKERHLLRAQLARIQHATEICPKGMFEIDEESGEVKMAEEFTVPGFEELKSTENWVHQQPSILKAGRCSHVTPAGMSEEEAEEYKAKLAESDPVIERFKGINEDVPMPGLETAWLSKACGDTQQYNKGEGTVTYAVNVLKSLRWPGSYTVSKNGKYCTIYVGDGLKRGGNAFTPIETPDVQDDPKDQTENPEPTPLEAPEEPPEPNTDDEGKPADGEEEDQ